MRGYWRKALKFSELEKFETKKSPPGQGGLVAGSEGVD